MIKTIAQIVPLIQFKFTFCIVTSNVANNFEVLTIKFGVHVNKAVCSLTRWLICVNVFNVFREVFNVSEKLGWRTHDTSLGFVRVSLCSDWLVDDRCLIWALSLLNVFASLQIIAVVITLWYGITAHDDSWGGLCRREAELRIWMVSSDSGHI